MYQCTTSNIKKVLLQLHVCVYVDMCVYIILYSSYIFIWASQFALVVKNPPANTGDIRDMGSILSWEDPLEKGMATHSSILVWRIAWTEELGRLQSMGLQRVGHN